MDNMEKPWFWISVPILCFSHHIHSSFGAFTAISANQSLSGDQTLISPGGVFELGFFKPGNSSNYYIGIWYKKVSQSQKTYVWVANRNEPVPDKYSAKLAISDGHLVLFDGSQKIVWHTNFTSSSLSSVEAVLLDSGNLVLRDRPNATEFPWQSFDNPTDTWLPGGKIRLNNRTKQPQYLTSWKNSEDPAEGLFSLELDPQGSAAYLILWNKFEQYWSSGSWNGQSFSLVREMRLSYKYNFTFVTNENESYFTYTVYNRSTISRLVMDVSGQLKQFTWFEPSQQWNLFWQPRQQCEVYASCGAFGMCNENSMPSCTCLPGFETRFQSNWTLKDYSGGCVRRTKLQCEESNSSNGKKDKFQSMANMKLPESPLSARAGNAEECQSICLSNCSCAVYAYDSNGCSVWHGDLLNLQLLSQADSNGGTLYLRLAASELPDSKNNKGILIGIVAGSVGGIGILLTILLLVLVRRRKRIVRTGKSVDGSLMAYGYRDLQNATRNFSEKLGGGGFGSVFKGTLPDSSVIAVKKLEGIGQGEKQFRSEVSTIGTIQHVNLVRLRGFCSEGARKLLVYDCMPNGSLDSCLFQEKNSKVLDWK